MTSLKIIFISIIQVAFMNVNNLEAKEADY